MASRVDTAPDSAGHVDPPNDTVWQRRPGVAPPRWRVRHRVRAMLSEHPALYLPVARRKYPGPSPEVIGPTTELVIDGYTRSACTFAVYALQLAQDRPVRLAHHLHAPAQLVEAARRAIPALLVIREPKGAILSQLVREPNVDMRDALMAYARFHALLAPYRDRLEVGEFGEVTTDFGAVIRRLNRRFGTSFAVFDHTEENSREAFELIKERPTLSTAVLGFESGVVSLEEVRRSLRPDRRREVGNDLWIPSPRRDRDKQALRSLWHHRSMAGLRRRAEDAYRVLVPSSASAVA
jgi:hypothetical protein